MKLPELFEEKMKGLLGGEFEAFLASYDAPRRRGLRLNSSKIRPEEFLQRAGKLICEEAEAAERSAGSSAEKENRIPWARNGFYVNTERRPAQHPYYAAGLYYLQEPSAMRPAECLPVQAGDRILDLCAAPGGKATELAVKLALADQEAGDRASGVLIANEIEPARAKALLRNLELTGMRNYCVLNEKPEHLAEAFPEYFDRILVDAPCSGEGMFRKEEAALQLWSQERVEACAAMQKEILEQAYRMLRPGGTMVYSTCTFSPEEDEDQIEVFTEAHPDMTVLKQERLWPHKVEGEGHFLTLLEKASEAEEGLAGDDPAAGSAGAVLSARKAGKKEQKGGRSRAGRRSGNQAAEGAAGEIHHPGREQTEILQSFLRDTTERSGLRDLKKEEIEIRKDRAYLPAADPDRLAGLHVIRNGLYLGDWKKNRFEPSQALALSLKEGGYVREQHFDPKTQEIKAFLHGESITADGIPDGWTLVCADRWPVGWGKAVKGTVKNHIPPGWRRT